MNTGRLAEIRLMAKYCTLDIGDAFRELLDHIDGLKFANGVLDSAAKDAQTWSYEAQTAKEAYCELFEANRVTEEAGGVIAQLNGMIDELRAQLEAQRGGAVVVPDLTTEEAKGLVQGAIFNAIASREDGCWDWCDMIIHGYKLAVSRIQPIPASQALQPGEVGVDREELMYLHAFEKYARKHGPESIQDVVGTLDHLRRAQQAKGE